ncbi:hypothetical protein UPYG_G00304100 [Umbra pygmaea]|uniref:Uncharacterized protein n=1 Tax=Umbra pygmaea TaxID=75934 RepID=A0ABD0W7U4_UMBPY
MLIFAINFQPERPRRKDGISEPPTTSTGLTCTADWSRTLCNCRGPLTVALLAGNLLPTHRSRLEGLENKRLDYLVSAPTRYTIKQFYLFLSGVSRVHVSLLFRHNPTHAGLTNYGSDFADSSGVLGPTLVADTLWSVEGQFPLCSTLNT